MRFDSADLETLVQLGKAWLEQPGDRRRAWIEQQCVRHPDLAGAILAMTKTEDEPKSQYFRRNAPALTLADSFEGLDVAGRSPGERIGPYELVYELGRGGMGAVWFANQVDGSLTRQVALKLPLTRMGLSSGRALLERFGRERNILAGLNHPGIATLFDAGLCEKGQPYFAMEYVRGLPITEYCVKHALGIVARVRLFLKLLETIQYAHSALIIHQDIKPGNVLVTPDLKLKLLDFGIARVMHGDADMDHSNSDSGEEQEAGLTLDYAAPERMVGRFTGVGIDIYSLGVVLYELLSGVRPYALHGRNPSAARAWLMEHQITAPSDRIASRRQAKIVQGDLDAIVLKALAFAPESRYRTALSFGSDLQRWMEKKTVSARPATPLYYLQRLSGRRWREITAGAVFVSMLIGATAVAISEASDARNNSRLANLEAVKARAVTEFMQNLFRQNSGGQADPRSARNRTAEALLDEGARQIGQSLAGAPEARIELVAVMMGMYVDLGIPDRSVVLAGEATRMAEKSLGPHHIATIKIRSLWADFSWEFGPQEIFDEQIKLLKRDLEWLSKSTDQAELKVVAQIYIAMLKSGALGRTRDGLAAITPAERLFKKLKDQRTAYEWEHLMGVICLKNGLPAEAERHFQAAESSRMRLGASGPTVISHSAWYGELLTITGKFDAAESHYKIDHLLERRNDAGGRHINDWVLARYARYLLYTGRPAEALALTKTGDEPANRALNTALLRAPRALSAQGLALIRLGNIEEGLATIDRAEGAMIELFGQVLPYVPIERIEAALDLGRLDDAEQLLKVGDTRVRQNQSEEGLEGRQLLKSRIALLLAQKQVGLARQLLERHRKILVLAGQGVAEEAFLAILEAQVEIGEGRSLAARQRLEHALQIVLANPHRQLLREPEARLREMIGYADIAQGDVAAARASLDAALQVYRALFNPGSLAIARVLAARGEVERHAGHNLASRKYDAAAALISASHPRFARFLPSLPAWPVGGALTAPVSG